MENSIDFLLRRVPVSPATLYNWQKEGLLPPFPRYADEAELQTLLEIVRQRAGEKLVSRANRMSHCGKLISFPAGMPSRVTNLLRKVTALAAERRLNSEETVKVASLILLQRHKLTPLKTFEYICSHTAVETRIDRLCREWIFPLSSNQISFYKALSNIEMTDEYDFLGLLYQALRSIGGRACGGVFYTPKQAVPFLGTAEASFTVYDPCCGSGTLLTAALDPASDSGAVYASDVDATAVRLCEVNLAIFFRDPDFHSHLFVADILGENTLPVNCDVILTNPPWGALIRKSCRSRLQKQWSYAKRGDSFGLILLCLISCLKEGGLWYVFLPESFLTVKKHHAVRRFVTETSSSLTIHLKGRAFPGVFSDVVFLEGKKAAHGTTRPLSLPVTVVPCKGRSFTIAPPSAPEFLMSAFSLPGIENIRKRLYEIPHHLLGDICAFVLGIVTGDNSRILSDVPIDGSEAVYRGCDILPFCLKQAQKWICFDRSRLRQCAPESVYRKPKIIYRFIGDRLICHYDREGVLILNSANALYPKHNDYPFETLVCLLNSIFFALILRSRFHSRKILRSHLEILPLPVLTKEQHLSFLRLYEKVADSGTAAPVFREEVDLLTASVFGFSKEELDLCRILLSEI